jgi:hypothetical protein
MLEGKSVIEDLRWNNMSVFMVIDGEQELGRRLGRSMAMRGGREAYHL